MLALLRTALAGLDVGWPEPSFLTLAAVAGSCRGGCTGPRRLMQLGRKTVLRRGVQACGRAVACSLGKSELWLSRRGVQACGVFSRFERVGWVVGWCTPAAQ